MKLVLSIFVIFLTLSSSAQDENINVIHSFVKIVKNNEVSIETFKTNYSFKEKFELEEDNYEFYLGAIQYLKDVLIQDNVSYKIIKYNEAQKDIEVYRINDRIEDVYVLVVSVGQQYNNIYFLMNNNRIESFSILRKGDTIIGWN